MMTMMMMMMMTTTMIFSRRRYAAHGRAHPADLHAWTYGCYPAIPTRGPRPYTPRPLGAKAWRPQWHPLCGGGGLRHNPEPRRTPCRRPARAGQPPARTGSTAEGAPPLRRQRGPRPPRDAPPGHGACASEAAAHPDQGALQLREDDAHHGPCLRPKPELRPAAVPLPSLRHQVDLGQESRHHHHQLQQPRPPPPTAAQAPLGADIGARAELHPSRQHLSQNGLSQNGYG